MTLKDRNLIRELFEINQPDLVLGKPLFLTGFLMANNDHRSDIIETLIDLPPIEVIIDPSYETLLNTNTGIWWRLIDYLKQNMRVRSPKTQNFIKANAPKLYYIEDNYERYGIFETKEDTEAYYKLSQHIEFKKEKEKLMKLVKAVEAADDFAHIAKIPEYYKDIKLAAKLIP